MGLPKEGFADYGDLKPLLRRADRRPQAGAASADDEDVCRNLFEAGKRTTLQKIILGSVIVPAATNLI